MLNAWDGESIETPRKLLIFPSDRWIDLAMMRYEKDGNYDQQLWR